MLSMVPYRRREANLFHYLDDVERNFFNNSISGRANFRTDISEKDGNYLLEAELPGFEKDDIRVELDGDTLTIGAQRTESNDEKDKDGNFIRRERRYGSFSRSFDVSGIDVENIKGDYKNGVLSLTLPKAKEPEAPEARRIPIGG